MVASRKSRKVICTVVCVPANDQYVDQQYAEQYRTDQQRPQEKRSQENYRNRLSNRPSELLPWADPTIARLVTRLQDEVRFERRKSKLESRISKSCRADLEPPWPGSEVEPDWDWDDDARWAYWE